MLRSRHALRGGQRRAAARAAGGRRGRHPAAVRPRRRYRRLGCADRRVRDEPPRDGARQPRRRPVDAAGRRVRRRRPGGRRRRRVRRARHRQHARDGLLDGRCDRPGAGAGASRPGAVAGPRRHLVHVGPALPGVDQGRRLHRRHRRRRAGLAVLVPRPRVLRRRARGRAHRRVRGRRAEEPVPAGDRGVPAHGARDPAPRHRGAAPHIAAPTLVVVGEDDLLCPPRHSRAIAVRIFGARLVEMPEQATSRSRRIPRGSTTSSAASCRPPDR